MPIVGCSGRRYRLRYWGDPLAGNCCRPSAQSMAVTARYRPGARILGDGGRLEVLPPIWEAVRVHHIRSFWFLAAGRRLGLSANLRNGKTRSISGGERPHVGRNGNKSVDRLRSIDSLQLYDACFLEIEFAGLSKKVMDQ